MTALIEGEKIADFSFTISTGKTRRLADLNGRNIVFYFYPKDNTPGCTREGQDFRAQYQNLRQLNTEVFGISRDSVNTHANFRTKHDFPFELISDPDEVMCELFDVIKVKNMFGKQVRGIERSTFLLDKLAVLRKQWRKLKVDGHVDEVISALKDLQ